MLHVDFITNDDGDTVDIDYYHECCAPAELHNNGWPGGMEVDSPCYCANCGGLITENSLTDYGRRYIQHDILPSLWRKYKTALETACAADSHPELRDSEHNLRLWQIVGRAYGDWYDHRDYAR